MAMSLEGPAQTTDSRKHGWNHAPGTYGHTLSPALSTRMLTASHKARRTLQPKNSRSEMLEFKVLEFKVLEFLCF